MTVKDLVILTYEYNFNVDTFTYDHVLKYGDLPYRFASSEVTESREMRYFKSMVPTYFFCEKTYADLEDFQWEKKGRGSRFNLRDCCL